jgi:mycothiol synthase
VAQTNKSPERVPEQLAQADRAAALALVQAVAEADGIAALSEDGRLALAHGRPGSVHLLWRDAKRGDVEHGESPSVAGYLYLSPADEAGDRTAELCVAPNRRGGGIGRMLVEDALAQTAGMLRIWAHGSLSNAQRLAEGLGFDAVRDLRLMELRIPEGETWPPPPDNPAPDGAAHRPVRTFRPGVDEAAWLALNARSFAHHPEQGSWTARDLAEREAEPWFDPAGFFLLPAEGGPAGDTDSDTDGAPIGFHWTKVHPAGEYGPEPVGEIYVLGVDPDAAGRGYGRLLAEVGLRHLAQSGLHTIVLYVDGDNAPAVRLYESLGFRIRTVDTLYERRGSG